MNFSNQDGYMKYNKTFLHRKIWEDFHGKKVPKGYVVHHKDHNKLNNKIENLELMSRSEHQRHHVMAHERVEKKCNSCRQEYKTKVIYQSHSLFCSKKCKAKFRRDSGVDDVGRTCDFCGKDFSTNKYNNIRFCSYKCSTLKRSAAN